MLMCWRGFLQPTAPTSDEGTEASVLWWGFELGCSPARFVKVLAWCRLPGINYPVRLNFASSLSMLRYVV